MQSARRTPPRRPLSALCTIRPLRVNRTPYPPFELSPTQFALQQCASEFQTSDTLPCRAKRRVSGNVIIASIYYLSGCRSHKIWVRFATAWNRVNMNEVLATPGTADKNEDTLIQLY